MMDPLVACAGYMRRCYISVLGRDAQALTCVRHACVPSAALQVLSRVTPGLNVHL